VFCDFGDTLGKWENPGRLSPECCGTMGVFLGVKWWYFLVVKWRLSPNIFFRKFYILKGSIFFVKWEIKAIFQVFFDISRLAVRKA